MLLGPRQRDLLAQMGGLRSALVVADALALSLIRRGLLAADANGSFAHITAAGLRALADEVDAGRIRLFDKSTLKRQSSDCEPLAKGRSIANPARGRVAGDRLG